MLMENLQTCFAVGSGRRQYGRAACTTAPLRCSILQEAESEMITIISSSSSSSSTGAAAYISDPISCGAIPRALGQGQEFQFPSAAPAITLA